MAFSAFLDSRREVCKAIVKKLRSDYAFASVLGTDVRETVYRADKKSSAVHEGEGECGFVFKMLGRDGAVYEYSTDELSEDPKVLVEKIKNAAVCVSSPFETVGIASFEDEPLKKDFERPTDFENYGDEALLCFAEKLSAELLQKDEKMLNAIVTVRPYTVSKLFISENRELSQCYGWASAVMAVICSDGKMAQARKSVESDRLETVLEKLPGKCDGLLELAHRLAHAEQIEPGYYDVITDPSITGLIAHEAFGHGVEMDQFVKDRALAKQYMGKVVASPVTNMRDGAAAAHSVASYFFDDDGVLAHDTEIIRNGVLVAGLSDLASAAELGLPPTGNGRRESFKRKSYTRMTNTFFCPGKDKLEDMIASVEHGYMLFDTNNGMEDPKNWQIQCTAEYGIEIKNGKLTDRYVSPVVMSGYVPDLLQSISMVSDCFETDGGGFCGKGYKEWVRVSDGGPHLKVKVKLG